MWTPNFLIICPWTETSHSVLTSIYFSSVQSLSRVRLFVTPWTAARQSSLSITNSRSLPKFMSIEPVMPSSHLIHCPLLLLFQFFPAWGSFPMSQFFASSVRSIGVSASTSVFPMNIQDWSLLRWAGCISCNILLPINNINIAIILYKDIYWESHINWTLMQIGK